MSSLPLTLRDVTVDESTRLFLSAQGAKTAGAHATPLPSSGVFVLLDTRCVPSTLTAYNSDVFRHHYHQLHNIDLPPGDF
ncbi:hypothetical protein M404DRAFT_36492 [Pisolithus tinctorius Marx 270]|uniref:Uncharacterized protein n=1 Tax=Pisolithus tinctorius Marx 270 TaxID=870435 RepID=A0A0C3I731_PISTI|nr:hypothetical protein M404DRAFT_36492 [Pisolithus tinctorius Marx 270]